jgi:hypothetical protein
MYLCDMSKRGRGKTKQQLVVVAGSPPSPGMLPFEDRWW